MLIHRPHLEWGAAFSALRYRNYRLWFIGQMLSLMGTWMQAVAQGWVVYQMTGSKLALGTIAFANSAPTLFLMLPAGAVIDRVPKRRLLLITQTAMMLTAFILAGLAAAGVLQVWHIATLAVCLGIANSFDAPARQAIAVEMVEDRADLPAAIALNSMMFNVARIVGPAVGGIILATLGASWCFGLNGASYLAAIAALLMMRFPATLPAVSRGRLLSQIGEGITYVRANALVAALILQIAMSSLFAMSYAVLLPAFAADVLQVGEAGLGLMNAAVGIGALVGSLGVAFTTRSRYKFQLIAAGTLGLPLALIFFGSAPSLPLSLLALSLVGLAFVTQNANINTVIQTIIPDELRGRVMAVYTFMFFGVTPLGSLQAGGVAQAFGPRTGVLVGALVALVFAVYTVWRVPALRRADPPAGG